MAIFFIILFTLWLGVLSYLFWRLRRNYGYFTHGATKKTLETVLENILKEQHSIKKDIAKLSARCDTIEKNEVFYIQRVGLLRFNPFKDTGGDQSFILSLGDGNNSGVILTGLYSRSGVRLYVKKVIDGKGIDTELSDEEKKALAEMGRHKKI